MQGCRLDGSLCGVTKESLKNTILQQLQALHREFGIPMLFVTHDAVEAIAICEEVLLLQAGRITERGDPAKLLG
jgi:ABC-type sulfate/molybdate transport systems ATPase subunit